MPAAFLTNGLSPEGAPIDIAVEEGRIAAIVPHDAHGAPRAGTIDLGGRLVLPGLIDGHVHLDKTLLGLAWMPHRAGPSVRERIDNERRIQASLGASVAERAGRLVELAVSQGTIAVRTHVDVDADKGLRHLHAVLAVKEKYRRVVDIEIVAFPQSGVAREPGMADLLDAAVGEGAGLVGGVDPATLDGDVAAQLDPLFAIAERRGAGIDIHLHNSGELGIAEVEAVIERTQAASLGGRVTVSHAFCLGSVDAALARRTAERLARAGVSVATACPGPIPLPPLGLLREAGVRVFAGSDNVRDAWSPFGNADMLERLWLICYRSGYRRDEEIAGTLAYATDAPASALGLGACGLAAGCRADLVAVEARAVAEAIVARPPGRLVFKGGRLVAHDGRYLGGS